MLNPIPFLFGIWAIATFDEWLITTDFSNCHFYERSLLHNYLMLSHLSSFNQHGNTTIGAA
ncbi:MAG: hypothetical protein V7L01_25675 [Nostoc sp.]